MISTDYSKHILQLENDKVMNAKLLKIHKKNAYKIYDDAVEQEKDLGNLSIFKKVL